MEESKLLLSPFGYVILALIILVIMYFFFGAIYEFVLNIIFGTSIPE